MIITGIEIKEAIIKYFRNLYKEREKHEENHWNKEINYSYIDVSALYTLEPKPTHYSIKYIHVYNDNEVVRVSGVFGIKYVKMTENDCSLYTLDKITIDKIEGIGYSIDAMYTMKFQIENQIKELYKDNETICSYYYG